MPFLPSRFGPATWMLLAAQLLALLALIAAAYSHYIHRMNDPANVIKGPIDRIWTGGPAEPGEILSRFVTWTAISASLLVATIVSSHIALRPRAVRVGSRLTLSVALMQIIATLLILWPLGTCVKYIAYLIRDYFSQGHPEVVGWPLGFQTSPWHVIIATGLYTVLSTALVLSIYYRFAAQTVRGWTNPL
ncbi:MAG: hypothetical protein ACREJO_08915 [Phycisphaerales bacterium]